MLAERSRQTSMTKNFLSTVLIALNLIASAVDINELVVRKWFVYLLFRRRRCCLAVGICIQVSLL